MKCKYTRCAALSALVLCLFVGGQNTLSAREVTPPTAMDFVRRYEQLLTKKNYQKALRALELAWREARATGDLHAQLAVCRNLAEFHAGKYPGANPKVVLPLLERTVEISACLGNDANFYRLRRYYEHKRDWTKAFDTIRRHIDLCLAKGDTDVYYLFKDAEDIAFKHKILTPLAKLLPAVMLGPDLMLKAAVAERGGKPATAYKLLLAAGAKLKGAQFPYTSTRLKCKAALLLLKREVRDTVPNAAARAEKMLAEARSFYESKGHLRGLARVAALRGEHEWKWGNAAKGRRLLRKAFQTASRARDVELQAELFETAAALTKDRKQARRFRESARQLYGEKAAELLSKEEAFFTRPLPKISLPTDALTKWMWRDVPKIKRLTVRAGNPVLSARYAELAARLWERTGDFDKAAAGLARAAAALPENAGSLKEMLVAHGKIAAGYAARRKQECAAAHKEFTAAAAHILKSGDETAILDLLTLLDLKEDPAFIPLLEPLMSRPAPAVQAAAAALESLGRAGEQILVGKNLAHPNPRVRESAAACLYRRGRPADLAVATARLKKETDGATKAYLLGCLAKAGNLPALSILHKQAAKGAPEDRPHALAVLRSQGSVMSEMALRTTAKGHDQKSLDSLGRALSRFPSSWATGIAAIALRRQRPGKKTDLTAVARGYRKAAGRPAHNLAGKVASPRAADWLVLPKRGKPFGPWLYYPVRNARRRMKNAPRWARHAALLGVSGAENFLHSADLKTLVTSLKKLHHAEDGICGTRKVVNLLDRSSRYYHSSYEVCVRPRKARLEKGKLLVELDAGHQHGVQAGGLAGAMYKESVAMEIGGSGLGPVASAQLEPAGKPPVKLDLQRSKDGVSITGNVGETDTDSLRAGILQVNFKWFKDHQSKRFPIGLMLLPDPDKPDLIPLRLKLEPPAPPPGTAGNITLTVINMGRRIEKPKTVLVRFSVLNTRLAGGRRLLGTRPLSVAGMEPRETRSVSLRQMFVAAYYTNKYSAFYEPVAGDAAIEVEVDAAGAVAEASEKNNTMFRPVALFLDKAQGKRLAAEELRKALEETFAQASHAKAPQKRRELLEKARRLLQRAEKRTPDLDLAEGLTAALADQDAARGSMKTAMEQLGRALRNNDHKALREATDNLARAQASLLKSGVPVDLKTVAATGEVLAKLDHALQIKNYVGLPSEILDRRINPPAAPVRSLLNNVAKVVWAWNLAQGTMENKRINPEDFLALMGSGANPSTTGSLLSTSAGPAFNSVASAILTEELKWDQEGWDLITDGMKSVQMSMDGKDHAADALYARTQRGLNNWSRGPFTPKHLKRIGRKYLTSVLGPVVGFFSPAGN